jgi:streptomycin 6-kinase
MSSGGRASSRRFRGARRFYTLVDAAGLDAERARAWVVVRVVQQATRELANPTSLTKYVALAKAVQD